MKALFLLFTLWVSIAYAQTIGNDGYPVVRWSTYLQGADSLQQKEGHYFLKTQGDLQIYWAKTFGKEAKVPKDIDWAKEYLIAVHSGSKETKGTDIYVEEIKIEDAQLVVHVVNETPSKKGQVQKGSSSPFVIVRLGYTYGGTPRFKFRNQEARQKAITFIECSRCHHGFNCHCGCHYCEISYPFEPNWSVLTSGQQCNVNFPTTMWITNEDGFKKYWLDGLGNKNCDRMPDIDFRESYLVAIHLGQKFTGGFGIDLTQVECTSAGVLDVRYSVIEPGLIAAQGTTSPFVVMEIPRWAGTPRVLAGFGRPYGK